MISGLGSNSTSYVYSAPLAGVQKGIRQMDESSEKIADGDLSATNVASDIEAGEFVKANSVALRTADQMVGTLINTVA